MQVSSISNTNNQTTVTIKDSLWGKNTTHKYTIPNDQYDKFTSEIQNEKTRWRRKTKATLAIGTIAGAILGATASKNATDAMKIISTGLCALAGAGLSALSLSQIFDIKHRALLSKYNLTPTNKE